MRMNLEAATVFAIAGMLAAAGCGNGATEPELAQPDLQVSIDDPTGDAFPSGASATPDITSATWAILRDTVQATVTFAAGAHLDSTYVSVNVDTDGDPGTGDPYGNQGVEFIVSFGAGASAPGVEVFTFTGSTFTQAAGPRPLTTTSSGFAVKIPLSMIGDDDGAGHMTVRFLVQHWKGAAWTGVLDMAPDAGQAPAVLAPT